MYVATVKSFLRFAPPRWLHPLQHCVPNQAEEGPELAHLIHEGVRNEMMGGDEAVGLA
jgi:hypothetical protein